MTKFDQPIRKFIIVGEGITWKLRELTVIGIEDDEYICEYKYTTKRYSTNSLFRTVDEAKEEAIKRIKEL